MTLQVLQLVVRWRTVLDLPAVIGRQVEDCVGLASGNWSSDGGLCWTLPVGVGRQMGDCVGLANGNWSSDGGLCWTCQRVLVVRWRTVLDLPAGVGRQMEDCGGLASGC